MKVDFKNCQKYCLTNRTKSKTKSLHVYMIIKKKYQDHLENKLTILSKSNLHVGETESNI